MHAVDVRTPGGSLPRLAVRRFVDEERLASDPWYRPANEARALGALELTAVPAPQLIAADLEGAECGVPTLLTEFVPGRNGFVAAPRGDLGPWLRQMAEVLPVLHELPPPHGSLGYEPYEDMRRADPPGWTSQPSLWRRVFDAIAAPATAAPKRFIHRDFHQGNTMWRRGRLTGVIDWTAACHGPSEVDLARMRQNLASELSVDTAEHFLDTYRQVIGDPSYEPHLHPYWELVDFADSAHDINPPRDADEAASLERFEDLVASVVAKM